MHTFSTNCSLLLATLCSDFMVGYQPMLLGDSEVKNTRWQIENTLTSFVCFFPLYNPVTSRYSLDYRGFTVRILFAGLVVPFQTDKGTRWPCDRCGKDFCSSSHLKRHWILHTDFKPFKCKVCGKAFPFHWDLKKHTTSHTGEKPFKCEVCDKSFNTQKERRNHKWLHTGELF